MRNTQNTPKQRSQTSKQSAKISSKKSQRQAEVKICGKAAVEAVFKKRRNDIIRAYVTEENIPEWKDLLQWAASQKKAYHVVSKEDLCRISETEHHEGICVLAKQKTQPILADWLKTAPESCSVLVLENIENPHNLGAIARVAAFFCVQGIVITSSPHTPCSFQRLNAAFYRTAEGGAEELEIFIEPHSQQCITLLKKHGFSVIATHCYRGTNVFQYKFPKKCAIILGSEAHGVSSAALENSDTILQIPNRSNIDSLNVACAATSLLTEYTRQTLSSS